MGRIIGIDLGTTYSCVSIFDDRKGQFVVIPGPGGTNTTPSVVGVKDGAILVGNNAKNRLASHPKDTVAEIKRHMGEPKKDGSGSPIMGGDGKPVPYTVQFANKEHTPQMISAYILRELKTSAELYLGEPVTGAVITVPAYFEGGPRRATEEAGTMAGLKVECLVSEPTAAAIAFGMTTKKGDEDGEESTRRILVYDLGGGTFDVSVIEITAGNIEVKGVGGDHYLGGVDFDKAIVDWAVKKIQADHDVDLRRTDGLPASIASTFISAYARIYVDAEKAKIALSSQPTTTLSFPFLFMHPQRNEMVNVELELSRNDFLTMIMTKLKGTITTVDKVLEDVKVGKTDIDDVILVGGSTRIPKVREMLEKHFGKPPRTDINPDECVAVGAAMQALRYVDTTALTKETERKIEEQLGQMGQVIDVTGHSLGVRESSDNMSVLIPKNTPIPAAAEEIYQTAADYQTQVKICVYQGEESVASRNTLLTEGDLVDLPPLPAGQVKVKIRFSLDVSGVLHVEATEMVKNQVVKFEAKYGGATQADPSMLVPASTVAPIKPMGGTRGMGGTGMAAGGGPEIPPSMQDTWKKAQELLPSLPADARGRLDASMKEYTAALGAGDQKAITDKGNALMDVLFDVMP